MSSRLLNRTLGHSRAQRIVCVLGLLWLLAACAPSELLSDAAFEPDTISPNADGASDITTIRYELGANATVSIYLEDGAGVRYYFRKEQPRPAGVYSVQFSGVVDGRLLPDGEYRWVIDAVSANGETRATQGRLTLQDGESSAPEIINFSILPNVFTPNRDGLSDRSTINVSLSQPADLYLSLQNVLCNGSTFPPAGQPNLDCTPYPVLQDERPGQRAPGEAGLHEFDYDAGVDRGAQPPPDGEYVVTARAEDAVGQVSLVTGTLRIVDGGVPRAEIVDGEWLLSASSLLVGQTLYFTVTVENYGVVPIRTSGPAPGYVYDLDQNFNVPGFAEESGAWRIGVDFDTGARDYPFRWAVGSPDELAVMTIEDQDFYYLPPGARATVTGGIHITAAPPRNPQNFWVGLIHEDVEVVNNGVDPQSIVIDEP